MTQTTAIDIHPGAINPAYRLTPSYTEALLDPGAVFRHPIEVAEHPWFTREEKRTVLLSWARDELVLEQVASRTLPELKPRSRLDAVVEALSAFDPAAAAEYRAAVGTIRAPSRRRSPSKNVLKRPVGREPSERMAPCRSP